MANVELRELQQYMLGILEEIDRICKKHDIQYFFGYGSCLGAVRHKGFIPWDDDIDLHMKMEDYFKFLEVCKTEIGDEYYIENHLSNVQSYQYWTQFGVKNSTSINLSMSQVHKAWGICVDIFPVFPYSKDPKEQKKRQKDFRKMRLLSVKYYHIGTLNQAKGIEKMKKMVHYLVPDWLNLILFRRYFNALCKEAKLPENRCQTIYSIYMTPEQYFENEWLDSIVELEYEGQKVPCPVGYHEYLKTQYGDYMQIPKNKENHSDDPNVVVNFSECYKKYWS